MSAQHPAAEHEKRCLFCELQSNDRQRIVAENSLAFATRDGFPVTPGHTLFIPKRHVPDWFGLTQAEVEAINQLMSAQKQFLEVEDPAIRGFNIGMNCGEAAGQSVFHCHVHLIPRRVGDVEHPKGGVLHVIPCKGELRGSRGNEARLEGNVTISTSPPTQRLMDELALRRAPTAPVCGPMLA